MRAPTPTPWRSKATAWALAALWALAGSAWAQTGPAGAPGKPPAGAQSAADPKSKVEPPPPPLVDPMPTVGLAPKPCDPAPASLEAWMGESLARVESQALRPGGSPRAKEGFADAWSGFRMARVKGWSMDAWSGKLDALYQSLWPAGPFSPATPFERFKEPRRACPKK